MSTTRVNLSLNDEVLDQLDLVINKRFYPDLPRASAIQILLRRALNNELDMIEVERKLEHYENELSSADCFL